MYNSRCSGNNLRCNLTVTFFRRALVTLAVLILTAATAWAETRTLTSTTGGIAVKDGDVVTGTGGVNTYLLIAPGATVTLAGIDIYSEEDYIVGNNPYPVIYCLGNAVIILKEGTNNRIRTLYDDSSGIFIAEGSTLTIRGSGSLEVHGGFYAAGIGACYDFACGNIRIEGGNITVYGGYMGAYEDGTAHYGLYGAGIGATYKGNCGNITITGGTINAEGSMCGASIGSSGVQDVDDVAYVGTCGDINITGGSVTVGGNFYSAGIGSGRKGRCGNINISGGTVNCTQSYRINAVAIGSGQYGTCGNITISGGTVNAYSIDAAAIGNSSNGTCGDITITGGNVRANDGTYGFTTNCAGIGNTGDGHCGNITIGGEVLDLKTNVYRGYFENVYMNNPYSIGPSVGDQSICGTVTVDGKTGYVNDRYFSYYSIIVNFYKNDNDATGTMASQVINLNKNATLPINTNAFTRTGYTFYRWNTQPDGGGYEICDGQSINQNTFDDLIVNLYAQWTPTVYTITYANATDGTDAVTNTNPTTYTFLNDAIILAEPTRQSSIFEGWTWSGQDQPTKSVTIPSGSLGNKTFTAHWTLLPDQVLVPGVGYRLLNDGFTLSGTGGTNTHIVIADGATVTLSGVDIPAITEKGHAHWAGITCLGDATIILADGTTNKVKGCIQHPGIFVPNGKTLTIQGNGTLVASTEDEAPGIGASYSTSCGNIVIEGGTIIATGAYNCAGIGGSFYRSCSNITITEGVTSVTATAGPSAPYSIGAGSKSSCGTVTIGPVTPGNIQVSPYTYTPSETTINTVTFVANGGTGTMENQTLYSNIPLALNAGTFTYEGHYYAGWNTQDDGTGTSFSDGQIVTISSNMTLYAQWRSPNDVINLTGETDYVMLYNGNTLTGQGGANTHVVVIDGATVTLNGVDITAITNDDSHKWAGITCLGNATIILADGTTNNVKGGHNYYPGINVPQGKTLTIRGDGTLNAGSNGYTTGIGAVRDIDCGNIVIEGGIINATASGTAAGIGSSNGGDCGDITITGGSITAIGGNESAGIGGTLYGSCGNITITDGVNFVIATAGDQNNDISIGEGSWQGRCGTVTIGGVVTGSVHINPFTYDPLYTTPYTVTFNANGGTGTTTEQQIVPYSMQSLNANSFTRANYVFKGWNTAADGSGTSYADEQIVYHLGNITLYALWEPIGPIGELILDEYETFGTAARWYINMPKSGTKTQTFSDAAVTTFKVYDDGGKNGRYSSGCDGYLVLTAPEGYIIQLSGRVRMPGTVVDEVFNPGQLTNERGKDYLTVYDNNEASGTTLLNKVYSYEDEWSNISTVTSSGQSMTLYFYSNYLYESNGLDLTVKLIKTMEILKLADNADNSAVISGADTELSKVTLTGRTLYKDGHWNTLCLPFSLNLEQIAASPLKEAVLKELDVTTSNLTGDLLTLNFKDATDIEAGKPYIVKWNNPDVYLTISSDSEWETFASNVSNGTDKYAGKLVKLGADINVSAMVGGIFMGILDGDGHTININISGDGDSQALFREIYGATIQKVNVTGTIQGYERPATFASFVSGNSTIINCSSSVAISSTKTTYWVDGGAFAARINSGSTLNLINCLFTGSVTYDATAYSGGSMVGFTQTGAMVYVTNCFYNPTSLALTVSKSNPCIFVSGSQRGIISNSYYNAVAKASILQNEGTDASSMTAGNLAAALGSGWHVSGDDVVPINYKGNLPPTANPAFSKVTIDATASTTVAFTGGTFEGTYSPLASTAGLLLDANNLNNGACRAALNLDAPDHGGLTFSGWYTDAALTVPVTTIPFADDGTVTLYAKFTDGTASVTFAKEGYSTYYNSQADALLPAGMKARIITAKGGGQTLTYETVADGDLTAAATATVPAGTAVMLQVAPAGATQSIDVALTSPAAAAISQANLLHGSDAETTTTGGDLYYKLSYNTGGTDLGWYWGAKDGGTFTSAAHKAWLALPSSGQQAPVRSIGLPGFNETTTDVTLIPYPAEQDDVWYDLLGRKLDTPPTTEGLYIRGGHKIMIK